jgi:hypothetical protein
MARVLVDGSILYSSRMPAAFTTFAHLSVSARRTEKQLNRQDPKIAEKNNSYRQVRLGGLVPFR